MATRIVGVFDARQTAEQARQELLRSGFSENDIRLVAGPKNEASGRTDHDEGWWDSIKDFFGFSDDEDTFEYREAARRGSTLATVSAPDERVDQAVQVMQRYGVVDLDERAQQWRSQGWQGRAAGIAQAAVHGATQAAAQGAGQGAAQPRTAAPAPAASRGNVEAVVPVVEEQVRVGKRAVRRGGVRVHSHVVERPVQGQVHLREERVHVERRPVDRPLGASADAFREQTIEATGSAEVPVVQKQARVVEEVVVGKEATERTETVRDTVRRTDVNVEKTDPR